MSSIPRNVNWLALVSRLRGGLNSAVQVRDLDLGLGRLGGITYPASRLARSERTHFPPHRSNFLAGFGRVDVTRRFQKADFAVLFGASRGKAWVNSYAVFPMLRTLLAWTPRSRTHLVEAERHGGRTIAIADDDPESLEPLPTIEVHAATSGAGLVVLLAEHGPFDLIVTDVDMPWNGRPCGDQVGAGGGIRVPVLVTTGLARPDLRATVDRLGNPMLLRKPIRISDLRSAVVTFLASTW